MSGQLLVSVIIPCYNQAEYLGECLGSLVAQTFAQWEAIVIDDASTQGNPEEIVRQIGDARCGVIRHGFNRGQAAARNTGIRAARAQLILPVDADDRLNAIFLEVTAKELREHSDIDCVTPDFQLFGTCNDRWHHEGPLPSPQEMLESEWITGAGVLMRKRVWETVGGYPEIAELRYGNEDWDFWIAAMQHEIKVAHVSTALYGYRQHARSASFTTVRFYDYITRETIYQRHQMYFDRFGAGNKFRAVGYFNSARASLVRGARLRAVWLALRGFRLALRTPVAGQLAGITLRALCPDALISLGRSMKTLIAARRSAK